VNLVIVESPTKSRKISKFLGGDYLVLSSKGHVYDLPKSKLGVDVKDKFRPEYVVVRGKKKVLQEIKKASRGAKNVYLATDLDREGEAIAWHVAASLSGVKPDQDFDFQKYRRVVFFEITKEAILEAFRSPRSLNKNLYDAQKARRILDRLVGYKLSPLLWNKIRYGLSAGRVQSVGLRLVVEREREREKFKEEKYWRIHAGLVPSKEETKAFEAELIAKDALPYEAKQKVLLFAGEYLVTKTSIKSEDQARAIIEDIKNYSFEVGKVEKKEVKQNPSPPYTTAAMQRAASSFLRLGSNQVMRLAQRLYEEGYITYHRTDSVKISQQFASKARRFLEKKFGKQFIPSSARCYQSKSKTAQEAHEVIRPTAAKDLLAVRKEIEHQLGAGEAKLYELIWGQAMASQMAAAVYERLVMDILAGPYLFRAVGSVLKFEGWKKIQKLKDRGQNAQGEELPEVGEGEKLKLEKLFHTVHQTQAPPRYTEASLIKDLESHEIGRPSTYAAIVSTILDRGYVGKEGKFLFPQDTGLVVNDLLVKHFPQIVDLKFTAKMEEDLDKIAEGKRKWVLVLKEFYGPFEKLLERKMKEIKKEEVVVMEKTDKKCPKCGSPMVVKLGKYGKFLSCSNFPKCDYAEFLDDKHTPEDEAKVDESQLQGKCPECGGELELKQGRFGRFIACSNYPKCKYTKSYLEKIGMRCPECKEGEVIIKRTRKGRVFYGCSRYPNCKYASWENPLKQRN